MKEYRPPIGSLPGEWVPPPLQVEGAACGSVSQIHECAQVVTGALSPRSCRDLVAAMERSGQASPVSVSGHPLGSGDIGSVRATAWAPELAAELWRCLERFITRQRTMTDFTPTDWYAMDGRLAHRQWRAVGIGPVLRFMRYESGGKHCAHYDMGFDYPDSRRSLMSLVIYLTDIPPGSGGRTRIVHDGQERLPVWSRNHEDWTREVADEEVLVGVTPRMGDVLFFDHRLCHDVEPFQGPSSRVIIRGDVVFEALDRGKVQN